MDIKFIGDTILSKYVNGVNVIVTEDDNIFLTFVESHPKHGEIAVVKLTCNPLVLKAIAESINDSVKDYEKRKGKIKLPKQQTNETGKVGFGTENVV